jgi:hypothetical protein
MYVYLSPHEYQDYLVIRAAALPGGQSLTPYMTQRMRETLKKIEGVDDRLIWTDSNGMLRQEQTWRAGSIRHLPRHQPELEAANHGEGKGQTTLVRSRVRTRLGDVMGPPQYMGHERSFFATGKKGEPILSTSSMYAGMTESMRTAEPKDMERNVRDSIGVQPFPWSQKAQYPKMSRPTRGQ